MRRFLSIFIIQLEPHFKSSRFRKVYILFIESHLSKAFPENFDDYDTVFVGYPNWWGTLPMCMFTLLEKLDTAGKTIIPFCTNEGSGMGSSERDLKKLCGGANIKKGLSIHGAETEQSEKKIAEWAKRSLEN